MKSYKTRLKENFNATESLKNFGIEKKLPLKEAKTRNPQLKIVLLIDQSDMMKVAKLVDDGVDAEVQLLDGLLAVLGPSLKRMRHFPDSATRWHCH